MPLEKVRPNKEVPYANVLIGSLIGAVLMAFAFLAGTHYSAKNNLSEQLQTGISSPAQQSQNTQRKSDNNSTIQEPKNKTQSVEQKNERHLPALLRSNLMNLDVTWINPRAPVIGPGGGISHYKDSVLLAKHSSGAVHRFNQLTEEFYQLKIFLPITNQHHLPPKTEDGRKISPLRYNSLNVYEQAGTEYLLSFHGFYNIEKNCRTVRLSKAQLPQDWLERPPGNLGIELDWQVIFEAAPCLPFTGSKEHVTGYQEGGAMFRDLDHVYFTTGDMGHDGIGKRKPVLTQSETSDYGRLFQFNLSTGQVSRIASGLRNTPSLAMDHKKRIWGVDIGPQGGDELNLLVQGKNYGWPYSTFGVDYTGTDADYRRWPYGEVLGQHDEFEKPSFFWPAAITPGGVAHIHDFHPSWDGDLIVAALTRHALIRLSMHNDRVLGEEILPLPFRLKSVLNAHERIYFLTDFGWLGYLTPRPTNVKLTPQQLVADRVLNNSGCSECHSNPNIPSLAGLKNREIGSQTNINYSSALQAKSGLWTAPRLKSFLSNPQRFAPGTTMPNQQLSESQIEELIVVLLPES